MDKRVAKKWRPIVIAILVSAGVRGAKAEEACDSILGLLPNPASDARAEAATPSTPAKRTRKRKRSATTAAPTERPRPVLRTVGSDDEKPAEPEPRVEIVHDGYYTVDQATHYLGLKNHNSIYQMVSVNNPHPLPHRRETVPGQRGPERIMLLGRGLIQLKAERDKRRPAANGESAHTSG